MTDITLTLKEWTDGDPTALDRLAPAIYPELRTLARSYLRRSANRDVLQTTAVVNELFVRLLAARPTEFENRRHFYVLAARIIRMALVDNYRRMQAEQRGGDRERVPLHEELAWVAADDLEILAFDLAMGELERMDAELAELVNLRFVLGCTSGETAEVTGLSKATVDRRVRLARAWLKRRMDGTPAPLPSSA